MRIYDGDLPPEDLYEEWATARRDALRQVHRVLLMELAAIHEEQGNLREAHAVLDEVIAAEPAYEPAHTALMRLHALPTFGQDASRTVRLPLIPSPNSRPPDAVPAAGGLGGGHRSTAGPHRAICQSR